MKISRQLWNKKIFLKASPKLCASVTNFQTILSVNLPDVRQCKCPMWTVRQEEIWPPLCFGCCLIVLQPFSGVLFSYYNYLSVNDIWDYLRLCCNPFNPWCIKFQANHKRENQHLAEMFKACDLHRNLFAQALPDEDLALLLV